MIGHGSPAGSGKISISRAGIVFGMILLTLGVRSAFAQLQIQTAVPSGVRTSVPIRLNISWSSAEPSLWSGEIRIEGGYFWNSVPLGSDPSAPVTFRSAWENDGHIPFLTREPVTFCGVQTTVVAPTDALLTVTLRNNAGGEPMVRTFSPGQFVTGPVQVPFDMKEHSLVIERAAGDEIPLTVSRLDAAQNRVPAKNGAPSMVFDPNETLLVGIFVNCLPAPSEGTRRLELALRPAGEEKTLWTGGVDLTDSLLNDRTRLDLPISLTNVEGAFDLSIELTQTVAGKNRFPIFPAGGAAHGPVVLAKRVIQGVVVPSKSEEQTASAEEAERFDLRGSLLETVDPTNPAWWKIFARRPLFPDPKSALPLKNPFTSAEPVRRNDSTLLGQKPDEKSAPFFNNPFSTDFLKLWRFGELQTRIKPLTLGGSWGQWDNFWQHSLGSGHLKPFESSDPREDAFVELAPSEKPGDISWESYTIPIKEPGKPHLLEIEYLPDYPQTLGVSILEPTVSGGVFPKSPDFGLTVPDDPLSDQIPHRVSRWQVLFWPKTRTPMILLMNPRGDRSALFGRIRIYRAKDEFLPLPAARGGDSARLFAAVLSRPNLCGQFLAKTRPSAVGVSGAEDWSTFYEASERLTDFLKSSGYNGLFLSVAADGSALYPSKKFRPNPRFDSGVFLDRGEDPVRKDVPELLLRLFRNEQMRLIPTVDFSAPLPVLEENRPFSADGSDANGANGEIFLIGPDGRRLVYERADSAGTYTPYNPLHPAVQTAMLDALDELVDRYASSEAFGGIGIDLSEEGFARLPDDIYYGLDDETIRRFVSETDLAGRCPAERRDDLKNFLRTDTPDRFRQRAIFIRDCCRRDWILWRASTLGRFYEEAARRLSARRSDAEFYLTGVGASSSDECVPSDFDSADKAARLVDSLLKTGLDAGRLRDVPGLVLLRSELSVSSGPDAETVDERRTGPETVRLFAQNGVSDGALFLHEPSEVRNIPSFDAASPFRPTLTQIATRAVPCDFQNRKRFIHQLAACETLRLADGGRMIPMGQEESLREIISVWRSLPPLPFTEDTAQNDENVSPDGAARPESTLQPVVYRTLRTGDEFWGYLVNDAPFHCGVELVMKFSPEGKAEVYVGGRSAAVPESGVGSLRWSLSLRPYDLVAFRITDPKAVTEKIEISRPDEICGESGRLAVSVRDAIDRITLATAGLELPMINPGFEPGAPESESVSPGAAMSADDAKKSKSLLGLDIPKVNLLRNPFAPEAQNVNAPLDAAPEGQAAAAAASADSLFGWEKFGDARFAATVDAERKREGTQSLRLESGETVGGVVSRPFAAPKTGRLLASLWFGIPDGATSLPLRVSLDGRRNGAPYQRSLLLGPDLLARAAEMKRSGAAAAENGLLWIREVVLFDDLPTDSLDEMTIRFDLLTQGTVWLDGLRLYKTSFTQNERLGVQETVERAEIALRENRVGELLDLLDSPLNRMLDREISDEYLAAHRPARIVPPLAETPPEPVKPTEEPKKEAKNFFRKLIPW